MPNLKLTIRQWDSLKRNIKMTQNVTLQPIRSGGPTYRDGRSRFAAASGAGCFHTLIFMQRLHS